MKEDTFVFSGSRYMTSAVKSVHVRTVGGETELVITMTDNSELKIAKSKYDKKFAELFKYFDMDGVK
jgi:hypothetical protein